MIIKIYFNEKPLFLCDSITNEIRPYIQQNNVQMIQALPDPAIQTMINKLSQGETEAGILVHTDLTALREAVWQLFTIVQAAGGLVWNEKNEILAMLRRGKWDLPKGKLDPGESLETCAVREVEEETGLHQLTMKQHLLTTYHTYYEKEWHILKESHWYEMQSESSQELVPQTSEDIHIVKWISPASLQKVVQNTFSSIIDVLVKASLLPGPGDEPI